MQISDLTLRNMARLLTREARLQLFEKLCKILGEPIPEKIWRETGIRKTDIYRYFPKSRSRRGGLVPSPKTTVRVIRALLRNGGLQAVLGALNPVEYEFRRTYREYFDWRGDLKKHSIIYDPLSDEELERLKKSLY